MKVRVIDLETNNEVLMRRRSPLNLEIWLGGVRQITISVNETGTSVQIPSGKVKINQTAGSFWARHERT